ncbi:MICOS complex subunit MIC19 isoform X1 [Photinus pyralis]|uniref:CHCH domain-containing protein n=1 Tax=Photinus pyralis TaxID=7054 RepID=A0A1Y1L4F2_PHOPY|nr:MICOS complex subunit MIC19 isoform X1 [Photinus pyralis]
MGSGSSRTRKLTLDNEDASNVIKVSEDVVQRLKSDSQVRSVQRQEVIAAVPNGPAPIYYYEPRLTSLQFQQEKSEALKKNDEYWERRIKDLESYHMEMHKVMEGEYNKAINEMNTKEKKLYACDTPPCQISKARVLECYKRNPNQAMKCLKEVEAFTACVDLQRSILIDAKAAS